MNQTSPVSRRTLLRASGAVLALPLLESLALTAKAGTAKPPIRFGIFTVTGGTVLE